MKVQVANAPPKPKTASVNATVTLRGTIPIQNIDNSMGDPFTGETTEELVTFLAGVLSEVYAGNVLEFVTDYFSIFDINPDVELDVEYVP